MQPVICERECAQRWSLEGDVTRLVEGADEVARFQHGGQHRGRIARIRAEISVAQIAPLKKRAPPERSMKISQCDTAPSREGPNSSVPRDDGSGWAKSSTVISNAPRWPFADRTVPFATGNSLARGGTIAPEA